MAGLWSLPAHKIAHKYERENLDRANWQNAQTRLVLPGTASETIVRCEIRNLIVNSRAARYSPEPRDRRTQVAGQAFLKFCW